MLIQQGYVWFANFTYDHQHVFAITVGGLMMYAVYLRTKKHSLIIRNYLLNALRGKAMTKKQRLIHNRAIQADAIYEALLELVEAGSQTMYDIQPTLRQLSKFMFLTDLNMKRLQKIKLSEEETDLLLSIMRSKEKLLSLVSDKHLIKIPGGHPKDDVVSGQDRAKKLALQALEEQVSPEAVFAPEGKYAEKSIFGASLLKTTGKPA